MCVCVCVWGYFGNWLQQMPEVLNKILHHLLVVGWELNSNLGILLKNRVLPCDLFVLNEFFWWHIFCNKMVQNMWSGFIFVAFSPSKQ